MTKEAKRRGLKEGVVINLNDSFWGSSYRGHIGDNIINSNIIIYKEDRLLIDNLCIFKDGKWVEIIEDKVPTINGYKMEDINEYKVKFGCDEFSKDSLKKLHEALKDYNVFEPKIISFNMRSNELVSLEELKEVVEYLNK